MDKRQADEKERHQALRLRRFWIAAATYLLWVGLAAYLDVMGLFKLELGGVHVSTWVVVAGMFLGNVAFYLAFRTGLNLRLRDPSLSMPMMLVALGWAILFSGGLAEVRGVSLMVFMMIMLFGIFDLRMRQYLFCWVIAVVGFAAIIVLTSPDLTLAERLRVDGMYVLLLAITLFWAVFFGRYVGGLRDKLAARNTELKEALAMVENLAIRDDLTGLHNRRYVMDMLKREFARAERHGSRFAMLLMDVDNFKQINDTHGHAAGDEVLVAFVRRLCEQVRGVDVVGRSREPDDTSTISRFGGEEFLVVLPDTGAVGARRVAERIRAAVAAAPMKTAEGPIPVTVSIGVAEHQKGEPVRDLLERADRAMYAAKSGGRNRVAGAAQDRDGTPMLYPVDGKDTSTDNGK
jgi:diguanylate cyclase